MNAEDFIVHLEMHPNGSFVLVKRDFDAIAPPLPLQTDIDKTNNAIQKIELHQPEETSRSVSPIILPEIIQNQIKVEPISEDEEEEECDYRFEHAVDFQNLSTNKINNSTNHDDINPRLSNNSGDPSHQLMVLNSSSRIGDGPGEYLCNVCNAKFVYKNNLKSHLKRHLGIYPYVCFYPSCGKRYQFKCKLNKHIEQVSQGRRLYEECQKLMFVYFSRHTPKLRISCVRYLPVQKNTSRVMILLFTFLSHTKSDKKFHVIFARRCSTVRSHYRYMIVNSIV